MTVGRERTYRTGSHGADPSETARRAGRGKRWFKNATHVAAVAAMSVLATPAIQAGAQDGQRGAMEGLKQVFALAPDPTTDGALLLGTEYGLLRGTPDGIAEVLPQVPLAVVGLTAMPAKPEALMLSGFGGDGNPGGISISDDGGRTWRVLDGTSGTNGVAVAQLSPSPANPERIAGITDGVVLSVDGGASWTSAAAISERTLSVATSTVDANRVYAGTMKGLLVSNDWGQSWTATSLPKAPVTAVAPLSGGRMAAFVYGTGFMVADEAAGDWTATGADFGLRYVRAIAEGPGNTIYAAADTGAVLMSRDGGGTWFGYEGSADRTLAKLALGQQVFEDNCQACHGVRGVGEVPGKPDARDEFGFKAPALDDSMHAWHHSDEGLMKTISEGSPRNERMIAWREQLSDQEIRAVIAWIKSLWSIESAACQGARHMACMQ